MQNQTIAIVGLGRKGSIFLERMLRFQYTGIHIHCVLESEPTYGKHLAQQQGIHRVNSVDELIALSDAIDIIFVLTDDSTYKEVLTEKLAAVGNQHTLVAADSIADLVLNIVNNQVHSPNLTRSVEYQLN
ncbi:MAG: Gfo/Idh/MocA family oxidoreductase [Pseudomonadota bacterium]|nr:Gfo/Idh/MocA family oxidoreductase [Pseudomonadota bacterium]